MKINILEVQLEHKHKSIGTADLDICWVVEVAILASYVVLLLAPGRLVASWK